MADLESDMPYEAFTKKWAKKPGIKLLLSKDIWGKRQKAIFLESEEKDDIDNYSGWHIKPFQQRYL